jgi:hypothetical protein
MNPENRKAAPAREAGAAGAGAPRAPDPQPPGEQQGPSQREQPVNRLVPGDSGGRGRPKEAEEDVGWVERLLDDVAQVRHPSEQTCIPGRKEGFGAAPVVRLHRPVVVEHVAAGEQALTREGGEKHQQEGGGGEAKAQAPVQVSPHAWLQVSRREEVQSDSEPISPNPRRSRPPFGR